MSEVRERTDWKSAFLEHELIYLRPFRESDIPVWTTWFNDAEVTHRMNKGYFPNTEALQRKHLEGVTQSDSDLQLAILLKEGEQLIGAIGLHKINWIHRTADISIVIGETEHWGKGYGAIAVQLLVRHAFEKLNLRKLTAGMWSCNSGSEACFQHNGFRIEGRRKEQFHFENGYADELSYGLLRSEWLKQNIGQA